MTPTFSLYGSQKRREKELKKIFKEISENFPTMGKEIVNQVQEAQKSLRQDKPKGEHSKTHNNQTDKN